ncbi:MAG TPA: carboxypeptidase-like regulatory domain-containing protein [Bryobacteraceae bacterium]|nr:carboxypeptidase-like regulatory domain-containing protein [Bryobacteraceae bacterium]
MRTGSALVPLLLFLAASLPAQQTEASISGIVADGQGAAIAGAEVTALNLDNGRKITTRANETGFYSLRPLPIGPYSVDVGHAGFRRYQRNGIVLNTGLALELNVTLEPGAVTESVTVTADSPLLDARSSEASQLIDSKTIEEMPMGDRRALNIVEITGAAVFVRNETGGSPTFSLAGGRVASQMFWVDGGAGQNMRIGVPSTSFDPPIETLQEIKIMANGFSSEFGASAGGVVVANTKSGSNTIKGSLFEYFRNEKLDAPNFFSPVIDGEKQRPSLRYNVFGGTVGGPVRRDRTFYFVGYEGSRRGDGTIRTLNVPSALERSGDFSQTFGARGIAVIYDPATTRREGTAVVRDPVPGNRLPGSRIDAVAGRLVPFFPAPNRPADDITGANNFRLNDVNRTRRFNLNVKLDHMLDSANRLTFRYLVVDEESVRSSVYPIPAADTVNQTNGNTKFYYGAWTRVVSPNVINELRGTYYTRRFRSYGRGAGEGWPAKLGLNGVSDDFFPNVAPAGFAALGTANQDRQQYPIRQAQLVDSLSWVRGRQSIKIGGEIRPSFNHDVNHPTTSGRYVFSKGFSGLPGNATTGSGFATMLFGTPTTFTTQETDALDRKSWYYAGFLQSDWTVNRALTVNMGVRWEVDTPLSDTNNAMNGFDPLAINPVSHNPGVVRFLGQNGFDRPYDPDWNNFGPRFGVAWRPFGWKKTVVRSGYGIFFAHPFDRSEANTASLGFDRSAQLILQDNNLGAPYTMAGGIPIPPPARRVLDDSFGAVAPGVTPNQAVMYLEPNRRTGYSQQFSLRIQHELPGQMAVEWGYIGNLSRKLPSANLPTNQIPPALLKPGSGVKDRPYPQFTQVTLLGPTLGVSSYHAGVLKLEKRFSRGFNILATYTWSKSLDNSDSGAAPFGEEGAAFSNYYDRRPDWGPSEIDLRHRVTWSSVYQLPFGKGRRFLANHWSRVVVGGWSVSGVMVVQTGGPVTVTTQTNSTSANSAGALRADILRDPNLPSGDRSIQRWFDTLAFRQPAQYTFGNQGIGHVRAPRMTTVNGSIIRTFIPWERKSIQFRGDLFNAPNHTNFGTPAQVFEGPGFGIINNARPARQVQLGLKISF